MADVKAMDDRTLDALKASIAKWERNAVAETPAQYLTSAADCPLCALFIYREEACQGCPVAEKTGETFCDGSPYQFADRARRKWEDGIGRNSAAHEAARAEVAFLKSLLPVSP